MLSNAYDKSIVSAKGMFYRTVEKELLVKVCDAPPKYCFTKQGIDRYNTMKMQENSLKGSDCTFEDFIKKYYWDALLDCLRENKELLEIKFRDIEMGLGFDFARSLVDNPNAIADMDNIIQGIDLPVDMEVPVRVSIVDIGKPSTLAVEEARQSQYVGKLIEVEGRVMMQTDIRPRFYQAAFKCQRCGELNFIQQDGVYFAEPFECQNNSCGRRGPFKLSYEDSESTDSQTIYIESAMGDAVQLTVILDKPLCAYPWERDAKFVRVVGVLNVQQVTKNRQKEFDFVLNACSIKLTEDSTVEPPTKEEIEMFDEWAKNPLELRQKIIKSVAPHICGRDEVKDILSLCIFSDWTWNMKPEKALKRSSLHVLLIGDPGVAKSQLIRDIMKLAPNAIMGQGENATGRGLSNSAIQVNGVWQIRAGLFAKGDRGIVGLDELDKIDMDDLKTLNSILEYQKQIADKAGMHVSFDTRCAAICGANPKKGHLNKFDPIIDQLGVSSFLYQRYDAVIVMQDVPNRDADGVIFDKNLETHNNATVGDVVLERAIPEDIFKKFVLYARSKPQQKISAEAAAVLKEVYLNLRDMRATDYPVVSARTGDALTKLTTAIARRELAGEATKEHALHAVDLFKMCILSQGFGTELDFMVIERGGTRSQLQRINEIRKAMQEISKIKDVSTIEDVVKLTGYLKEEVHHTLKSLVEKGSIVELRDGYRLN